MINKMDFFFQQKRYGAIKRLRSSLYVPQIGRQVRKKSGRNDKRIKM